MILNVFQALRNPEESFSFQMDGSIDSQEVLGEQVHFDQVHLVGTYKADENLNIEVTGHLATHVHSKCAKCLEKASTKVEVSFAENFVLNGDPEDLDIFQYRGNEIDLHRLMFTTAILALPMQFLCKKTCKGLCSKCGGDLNKQACACGKNVNQENPFAVLKQLLNQNEGV